MMKEQTTHSGHNISNQTDNSTKSITTEAIDIV